MRLLGLDAEWSNDADDPELVARAVAADRVLLTQDRRLLMRRALRAGALVRGSRPDDQLADVLSRFAPPLAPLTRCTACGGALAPVPKEADRRPARAGHPAQLRRLLPVRRLRPDLLARRPCPPDRRPDRAAAIDRATLGGTTEETDRGALRR